MHTPDPLSSLDDTPAPLLRSRRAIDPPPDEPAFVQYEIPAQYRAHVHELSGTRHGLSLGYASLDARLVPAEKIFFAQRARLVEDAARYFARDTLALPPRPDIAPFPPGTTIAQALGAIYERGQGWVVGESHSDSSSKQLLIESMADLQAQGVRTLYMEHLLSDAHQQELDVYCRAKSTPMPASLQAYLQYEDIGQMVPQDSPYTFQGLVETAKHYGMRVVAIDCYASYFMRELGLQARLQSLSYYGKLIIQHHQSQPGAGKWVALVGSTHANYTSNVPGLAELTGATGLRVVPKALLLPSQVRLDVGDFDESGRGKYWIQSDYLLSNSRQITIAAEAEIRTQLAEPGRYLIRADPATGEAKLWIHTAEGTIEPLPILHDHGQVYLDYPAWQAQQLHLTRYPGIGRLCHAIETRLSLRRLRGEVYTRVATPGHAWLSQAESNSLDRAEIARRLDERGKFLIQLNPENLIPQLWHRSGTSELVTTSIKQDRLQRYYIERPQWKAQGIHLVRFNDLEEFSEALRTRLGMTPILGVSSPDSLSTSSTSSTLAEHLAQQTARLFSREKNAVLLRLSVFATPEERAEFREGKKASLPELERLQLATASLPALQAAFATEAARLSVRQQGALLQAIHTQQAEQLKAELQRWQQAIEQVGGSAIRHMAQNLYLAAAERQQGVCAALSAQLAASWRLEAEGSGPHLGRYLDRLHDAIAEPDSPSARIFGLGLLEWSFRPALARFDAQFEALTLKPDGVIDTLLGAPTPSAYELSADTHAATIGVAMKQGLRIYYFADPNYGYAEFRDTRSLRAALDFSQQVWPSDKPPELFALSRYRADLAEQTLLAARGKKYRGPDDLRLADLSGAIALADRFNHREPLEQDAFFRKQVKRLTVMEYRVQLKARGGAQGSVAMTPLLADLLLRHQHKDTVGDPRNRLHDITFKGADAFVWLKDRLGQALPRLLIDGAHYPQDVAFLRQYLKFCQKLEGQTSVLSRLFGHSPKLGFDTLYLARALPEHGRPAVAVGRALALSAERLPAEEPHLPEPEDSHRLQLCGEAVLAEKMASTLHRAMTTLLAGEQQPGDWIPMLHTIHQADDGQLSIDLRNRIDPEQTLRRTSRDPALLEVKRYLDHAQANIRRGAESRLAGEPQSVDGLNSAFAIQALLQWLANRDRAGSTETSGNRGLVLAVQIHEWLNGTMLGQGVALDVVNVAQLVRSAQSARGSLPLAGASAGLLAKAGLAMQAGGIVLDIYELTQSGNERQKAVFGTHLAFDSAGLGVSFAGMAGWSAAGPAGVLLAGFGIGIAGLVDAFSSVAENASQAGSYFGRLRDGYTPDATSGVAGYRVDPAYNALIPHPAVVFRRIDLRAGRAQVASPLLYPTKHGKTGSGRSNYFLWAGDMPKMIEARGRAIDVRARLGLPEWLSLPAADPGQPRTLYLPALPVHYITYRYNILPGATMRHDYGFDVLRQLEGDDFDFDFYIFPIERIIDHLGFEYVATSIDVILGDVGRRIQMAGLPRLLSGLLHYRLCAGNGRFVIGLAPGAGLTLEADAGTNPEWILDGRNLPADDVSFAGQTELIVGGIRIQIPLSATAPSILLLQKNGSVLRVDPRTGRQDLEEIDASVWPPHGETLGEHLHRLGRQHLIAARHVLVRNYSAPGDGGGAAQEIPRAYYDQEKQEFLYIEPGHSYPDLQLAARQDNVVFFFNRHNRTKLLQAEADTHQLVATYQLVGDRQLRVWNEGDAIFMASGALYPLHSATYRIVETGLVLAHIFHADDTLAETLQRHDRLPDLAKTLQAYLIEALAVTDRPRPAQLPGSDGMVVVDWVTEGALQQRYWLRMQDGAVIRLSRAAGDAPEPLATDLTLVGIESALDGQEWLYFFSRQQRRLFRQQGANPPGGAQRLQVEGLADVRQLNGRICIETQDGRVLRPDARGQPDLTAVTGVWVRAHPAWWDDARALAGSGTLSLLDIRRPDGRMLPTWLVQGKIVVAADSLSENVELLGLDATQTAAWVHDHKTSVLYRQALPDPTRMAQMFDGQGNLRASGLLPPAEAATAVDSVRLLGDTLSWGAGDGRLPPAIAGVEQLLLVPGTETAIPIAADAWIRYRAIVVDPVRLPATARLQISLEAPDPLALQAEREDDDLHLLDRGSGRMLILRQAFSAGTPLSVSIALPDGMSQSLLPIERGDGDDEDAVERRRIAREIVV
jgi:hypothetical protein